MLINPEYFFPATIKNLQKLKKVIDMTDGYDYYCKAIEQIILAIKEAVIYLESEIDISTKEYFDYMQKKADHKVSYKYAMSIISNDLKTVKNDKKLIEKYKNNLKQVQEWRR